MVGQIAFSIRSGNSTAEDWATVFFIEWNGSLVGVTARHFFAKASMATPIELYVREPSSTFQLGLKETVIPILHPVADVAVVRFSADVSRFTRHSVGNGPPSLGSNVNFQAADSTPNLVPFAGRLQRGSGIVTGACVTETSGRFSSTTFPVSFSGTHGHSGAPVSDATGVVGVYSRSGSGNDTLCVDISALNDIV